MVAKGVSAWAAVSGDWRKLGVEAIVSSIWFNQGQVCCAGSRLLVQENVSESLVAKLKWRLGKMRVGASLDKCMDSGAMVDRLQCDLDLDLAEPSAHSVT